MEGHRLQIANLHHHLIPFISLGVDNDIALACRHLKGQTREGLSILLSAWLQSVVDHTVDVVFRHRCIQHHTMQGLVVAIALRRIARNVEGKENIVNDDITEITLPTIDNEVFFLHLIRLTLVNRIDSSLFNSKDIIVAGAVVIGIACEFSIDKNFAWREQRYLSCLRIDHSHRWISRPIGERQTCWLHFHIRRIEGVTKLHLKHIGLINHRYISLGDGDSKFLRSHIVVARITLNHIPNIIAASIRSGRNGGAIGITIQTILHRTIGCRARCDQSLGCSIINESCIGCGICRDC